MEFTINLCRRLRLRLAEPGCTCTHMRRAARQLGQTADEAPHAACSASMDVHADHAVQCMIGGNHTAIHDAVVDELARYQQQAGLRSRREVYTPQLATPKKTEPRADIMCWGHVALPTLRLDLTVISPWASHNLRTFIEAPATIAHKAEMRKADEYGAKGGISMQGLAIEAGGRFGPSFSPFSVANETLPVDESLATTCKSGALALRYCLAGSQPTRSALHLAVTRTALALLPALTPYS